MGRKRMRYGLIVGALGGLLVMLSIPSAFAGGPAKRIVIIDRSGPAKLKIHGAAQGHPNAAWDRSRYQSNPGPRYRVQYGYNPHYYAGPPRVIVHRDVHPGTCRIYRHRVYRPVYDRYVPVTRPGLYIHLDF
jgi:hypothetical protein